MINQIRSLALIIVLATSLVSTALANTCDNALFSYANAVEELARGYIGLEKMKIEGASGIAQITAAKALAKKREQIITEVGEEQFNTQFSLALIKESGLDKNKQDENRIRRAQNIEKEEYLKNDWELLNEFEGHYQAQPFITPDSQFVVSVNRHLIQILDIKTAKLAREIAGFNNIEEIKLSPDGQTLAVRDDEHRLRLFNFQTGEEIFETKFKYGYNIQIQP